MADAQILKEFLTVLGYRVDEHSEKKFLDSVAYMGVKVAELGFAVAAAATAVVAGVSDIAHEMESLYFTSKRVGSSADHINAFAYAVSQMGGTTAGAKQSLEGFAQWFRQFGSEGILNKLGVKTRDASNNQLEILDMAKSAMNVFKSMPLPRVMQYAQMMHIDQNTLFATMNGLKHFEDEYEEIRKRFGVNSDEAAETGLGFNRSLRKLGDTVDVIKEKILLVFGPGLTKQLDEFQKYIEGHSDQISNAIHKIGDAVVWMGGTLITGIIRMSEMIDKFMEWFDKLDPRTKNAAKIAGELLLAWKILNAEMLNSPIGRLVALAAALTWLYDDYQKFKEGGKSTLDWATIAPQIEKLWAVLGSADTYLKDATGGVVSLTSAITDLVELMIGLKVAKMIGIFKGLGWLKNLGKAAPEIAAAGEGAAVAGGTGIFARLATGLRMVSRLSVLGTFLTTLLDPNTTNAGEAAQLKALGLEGKPSILNNPGLAEPGTPSSSGGYTPSPGTSDPSKPGFLDWIWSNMRTPHFRLQFGGAGIYHPGLLGSERTGDAHKAVEFLRKKGWSLAQAAGIAANLQAESNFNPSASGDGGAAYGIAQWHPDRQALFTQWSGGRDIHGSSFEDQLGFLDWELRNSPSEAKANYYMQHSESPEQAASAGVMSERPADTYGAIMSRGALGRQIFEEENLRPENKSPSGSGDKVSMNQTNNITVHGSSDPSDSARRVRQELDRSNADLVRNARGSVLA